MSIYKQYKHGACIKCLIKDYGLRRTFASLRYNLPKEMVRLKNNKIQVFSFVTNEWTYES